MRLLTNLNAAFLISAVTLASHAASAQTAGNAAVVDPMRRSQLSEPSRPQVGPHGGTLRRWNALQLEILLSSAGVRVHFFDSQGRALEVTGTRGIVALRVEGEAKRYRYNLLPDGTGTLAAAVDLSKLAGKQLELDIRWMGLPGMGARPGSLQEVASVPADLQQLTAAAIARQKTTDQAFIAAQQKCPVMDEPLDAMGGPYKVNADGKAVYICCPGCAKRIAADPHKYLAILAEQGIEPPAMQ